MSKTQNLVNSVYERFGLDVSELTEEDMESLILALKKLKDMDLHDIDPPGEFLSDDESYLDEDLGDIEAEDY